MAEAMIRARIDPDKKIVWGYSPITIAAKNGHSECISALISGGVDVNKVDYQKNTAVVHAVKEGHVDCLRLLLKAGAHTDVHDSAAHPPMKVLS